MNTQLYTRYKPMRRRMTPGPTAWWVLVGCLVFGWWLTLAPAAPSSLPAGLAVPSVLHSGR